MNLKMRRTLRDIALFIGMSVIGIVDQIYSGKEAVYAKYK